MLCPANVLGYPRHPPGSFGSAVILSEVSRAFSLAPPTPLSTLTCSLGTV